MSDILNIRVTERELDLIMDLLNEANDRCDADGQPAFELCHDLMEQAARHPDDWDSTDLEGRTFTVAEEDFIDHGTRAREMQKASSMAANRRTLRFGEFTVESKQLSEQQRVDVFENKPEEDSKAVRNSRTLCGNDPIDW
tara:strand:+ start:133 stop:552 length:420 start_codon:yes stop_codon:yes gene_type:complete